MDQLLHFKMVIHCLISNARSVIAWGQLQIIKLLMAKLGDLAKKPGTFGFLFVFFLIYSDGYN